MIAKNAAQARAWYARSAAARHPGGMASFGIYLLFGSGGPRDIALGLVNLMDSALLGSDFAAYQLGQASFRGSFGLPIDFVRARFWLKKAVTGECEVKHLTDKAIADAANWLRELDGR